MSFWSMHACVHGTENGLSGTRELGVRRTRHAHLVEPDGRLLATVRRPPLGAPLAQLAMLGHAVVCYFRGKESAACFPHRRELGIAARRHHTAIATQVAEEKVLRHLGVPDVPPGYGPETFVARGEDGIPSGFHLCRSCLICRPGSEYLGGGRVSSTCSQ